MRDLNRARKQIRLKPVASASNQLGHVARVLIMTSASFDPPPASMPSNVRYVGPQLDRSPYPRRWDLPFRGGDSDPLVVVGFSSRFAAGEVVQRVLNALGTLPVRALLTLGPALRQGLLRVPANVVVRQFVPHTEVLAPARLVVTHAGLGTVMAALAYGVPLLCIPLKNDQYENAARVVATGAGLRLGRRATSRSLRRAILQVLNEPSFTEAARRLANSIATEDASALRELEALAALQQPAAVTPLPAE
jgi:MGT family glycosyltransferase